MKIKYNNYLLNHSNKSRYYINSIMVIYNFLASPGCSVYFYFNNNLYSIYKHNDNIIIFAENYSIRRDFKLKSINYQNISESLNRKIL